MAPEVVDGVLPRNQHGNIEIWGNNPVFVPRGACHLTEPGIQKLAKELDMDYALAIIGNNEALQRHNICFVLYFACL